MNVVKNHSHIGDIIYNQSPVDTEVTRGQDNKVFINSVLQGKYEFERSSEVILIDSTICGLDNPEVNYVYNIKLDETGEDHVRLDLQGQGSLFYDKKTPMIQLFKEQTSPKSRITDSRLNILTHYLVVDLLTSKPVKMIGTPKESESYKNLSKRFLA